jgi:hypothetical protein
MELHSLSKGKSELIFARTLTPVAAAGLLPDSAQHGFRFESWFRTGQRKHKAFLSAKPKPQSQTL